MTLTRSKLAFAAGLCLAVAQPGPAFGAPTRATVPANLLDAAWEQPPDDKPAKWDGSIEELDEAPAPKAEKVAGAAPTAPAEPAPAAESAPAPTAPAPAQVVKPGPLASLYDRPTTLRHILTFHPLPLALRGQVLAFEYQLTILPQATVHLGPSLSYSFTGTLCAGLEAGGRWYPFGKAPDGYFAGAGLGYVQGTLRLGDKGVPASGVSLGLEAGRTFLLRNFWVLSGGLGLRYHRLTSDSGVAVGGGLAPSFRVAVGAGI